MRGSTRRSTAASGTRRDSIPTTCARSRISRRRCRSITKRDLRDAQARVPPFGDYLCVAGRRGPSHPRHVRHDRPADGLRDRPQRLGCDRQCARPHSLGHGPAAGRRRLHRGDLQPVHGLVGHARRRRAPAREGVSVRRRRARDDRARRDVARPDEAVGVLLDAVVRAASRRSRARGRLRSEVVRVADDVLLGRAGGVGAGRARQDRRRIRRARDRLRVDGRNDARS